MTDGENKSRKKRPGLVGRGQAWHGEARHGAVWLGEGANGTGCFSTEKDKQDE
jgi:hypothetical protein